MELTVGHMTLKELSVWFGLKPTTLPNYNKKLRKKKFDILKSFCDFHFEGNKLYIDEVYVPIYSKAYEIIEDRFDNEWGNLKDLKTHQISWQKTAKVDSCTRVGKAIWHKVGTVSKQIGESTAVAYANQIKRERYGRTYKDEMGTCGYCTICYLDEDGLNPLPEDKLGIMKGCRKEAYEKIGEQIFQIDEAYRMGEITENERLRALSGINTDAAYIKYEDLMYERLGFLPMKLTQLFPTAWTAEEQEADKKKNKAEQ